MKTPQRLLRNQLVRYVLKQTLSIFTTNGRRFVKIIHASFKSYDNEISASSVVNSKSFIFIESITPFRIHYFQIKMQLIRLHMQSRFLRIRMKNENNHLVCNCVVFCWNDYQLNYYVQINVCMCLLSIEEINWFICKHWLSIWPLHK